MAVVIMNASGYRINVAVVTGKRKGVIFERGKDKEKRCRGGNVLWK